MEESWRFQPARASICPTCRVSHFPFCPPPLPFYGNGFPSDDPFRFPAEAPAFHRPGHAPPPFLEHRRMSPPPLPHHPNPMAQRGAEPWSGYSLLERDPFRQPFHPTERLISEEFLERERFRKRMRVEDGVLGYSASPQGQDRFGALSTRISSEDERRLNLIRDHGRAQVNLPFDGEQRPNGVPVDRYPSMDSQSHYTWSETDRDLYGPRSGLTGNNSAATHVPLFFNPNNPSLREGSYGGYQDPTGATDFLDPGRFVHLESKELERKDWDARNIVRSNASPAGISQEQYGHPDAPSHPSRSYGYGYGDVVAESLKHYTARHIPDVNSKYKQYLSEEPFSKLPNQVPQSSSYAASQESREMLGHLQHLRQTCVSEPGYPHTNSYQSPLVSKVGHYGHVDGPVHEYVESKHELHAHRSEGPLSFETEAPLHEDSFSPLSLQNYHMASRSNVQFNQRDHMPMLSGSNVVASMGGQVQGTQTLHPPPPQPLLRPPPEPPLSHFQVPSSLSIGPPPISPVTVGLSVDVSHRVQGFSGTPAALEAYISKELPENTSTGIATERQPLIPQILSNRHVEDGQSFSLKHALTDRKTIIDAANIFFQPHRATRPDHIVVILRGLPGSGKSYLAKVLRDLEIDNGGNAPRIHCMDDYFMTEVEKVEESDGSKSSGSIKGKKQVTRKVMEYCYEPEMEEAYRSSMLKAFKKTVEDGIFTFVIVDDRNLRVADFAQFWAIGKRSGYEVYLLEATYKDPTGCAARNVHGFTLDDIKGMADKWEQAPALYLQLDIQSLFRGDDLNESNIQEVDMDTEDMSCDERVVLEGHDRKSPEGGEEIPTDKTDEGSLIMGGRWVTEGEDLVEARELGKSKWSKDFDEDGDDKSRAPQKSNALSGLIQAYGKGGKSVRWGDRVGKEGFSIGASNNQCISLIIGSGSGYNVKSNPLPEEESSVEPAERNNTNTSRRRSAFLEHIRAERESFRAVFDRRRQRIGGLNDAEDD